MRYQCPVCKKTLSKKEYEAALGILEGREKHIHGENRQLRQELVQAKQELKNATREARSAGRDEEKKRTARLVAGYQQKMEAMKQRIGQLERGTTPQTEGLEFEDELAARLAREFPEDQVILKGKGGDVLHIVMFQRKEAGKIIYECKRTPRISGQHVRQAAAAKQVREADFAVCDNWQAQGI
ncbi:MAG TPA: hypothetical protein VKG65_11715 [Terriglobales bacterium]|nr:hypothetical protein [Terriglobales bacterium]